MTLTAFHLAGQHNQASHGDSGGVSAAVGKLKSGGTIKLASGESLARSDVVQQRGGGGALLAAVDTDDGARRVRLGVIGDQAGVPKWSAANKGATAELSPAQARALADGLTDSTRKARQQNAEADAVIEILEDGGWDPDDRNPTSEQRDLLDRHDSLTSGLVGNQQTIPTPWGDVVYGTRVTDAGPSVALAVVSDDADADWTIDDAVSDGTALDLTLAQVRALASKLRANAGEGQTAAVDYTEFAIPEQLADYWLHGDGAAKVRWCTRGSWRRARRLLRKYVKNPAQLDGLVTNLYVRACGHGPRRSNAAASLAAQTVQVPTVDAPELEVAEKVPTSVGGNPDDGTYNRVYWSGPLAPIDIATGDRREFAPDALSTRQLPLQLSWQEKRAQGHDGAVVVGSLTGYDIAEDGTIMGRGYFLDPEIIPDVRKAMHLVEHGVIGPSVDLEPDMDVTWVDENGEAFDTDQCQIDGTCPDKPRARIARATMVGATLVPITAFAEARAPRLSDHAEFCLNPQEGEDVEDNNQTASTSLTACGCASRAGVTEFSVATDGTTCACDPDGVARPMAAGGEFCACKQSQTAAADEEHADCRPNEFCRSPLHPGPCKGWKNKTGGGDSGGSSSSGRSSGTRAKRAAKPKAETPAPAPKADPGPAPKHVKDAIAHLDGTDTGRATLPTSLLLGDVSEQQYRDHFTPAQRKDALAQLLVIRADMGDDYTGSDKKAVENGITALEGQVPGDHQKLAEDEAERKVERLRKATSDLEARLQELFNEALADPDNTQDDLIRTRDAYRAQSQYARERMSKAEQVLAKIRATRAGQDANQTAAVRSDFDDLPIAPRDMAWDVGDAEAAISRWATDADGDIDFNRYGRAFLYRDPEVSPRTKGAYKFPVATVLGGGLTIVPRAVFAAAGRLDQADVSGAAREMLRVAITDLYDQMAEEFDDDTIEAPWEMAADPFEHGDDETCSMCPGEDAGDDDEMVGASVRGGEFCGTCGGDPLDQVAAAYGVFGDIPPHPIEAFQRTASGPTPMTVLEDGSVFGHIAAWDSCNRGVRGRCVPPPKSKTNYAQFHTVPIRTTEGTLRVGKIVMGEGHADVNGNMQVTRAFYDKAGKTAAHGRAHEDQWGVFFSGVIGPNLTPADVVEFFSMPPSGHWTEHRPTRSSELIAVAAVNVQGHPVPGPDLVLNQVASGYYEPEEGDPIEDAAAVFAILDQADWHAEASQLATNLF